jgi:DNA (cytosine-5)-methyltransferase 1
MTKLRVLDLFSGIAGFSVGLERTGGFETVAFCEKDEFCRRVIAKHFPKVPIYDDICELTAERLAADGIAVDVVTGGFPCQPFSTASRGVRVARDYWPELDRLVTELRPAYAIAENVAGLPIRRAARRFEALGYRVVVKRVGAHDAGADHTRDRWWAVAYANHEGELHCSIDAEVAKLPEVCRGLWGPDNYARAIRVPHGVSNRVDRFKSLGNTVAPFIPEAFGRAILASRAAS